MRRNSRILLLFGIIWFSGVYLYVRNSENTSGVYNAESNPRHGNRVSKDAHEKRKKIMIIKYEKIFFQIIRKIIRRKLNQQKITISTLIS
jgi:hypothetical protein